MCNFVSALWLDQNVCAIITLQCRKRCFNAKKIGKKFAKNWTLDFLNIHIFWTAGPILMIYIYKLFNLSSAFQRVSNLADTMCSFWSISPNVEHKNCKKLPWTAQLQMLMARWWNHFFERLWVVNMFFWTQKSESDRR